MSGERPASSPWTRADSALVALFAVLTAGFFALYSGIRLDDAYITFRYAENLAGGAGYVFNQGERVLATTSPLHTLLLALLSPVAGAGLPVVSNAIGSLALGCQALLIYLLLRDAMGRLAAVPALLVLLGMNEGAEWLPLETNLSGALVLGTVLALHRSRSTACGLLLGAAFLCRYDAALLVPVVAVAAYVRERHLPVRMLGVALAVVAPWLLFAWAYFGSPLPHTLAAKLNLVPFGDYLAHFVLHALDRPWAALADVLPAEVTRLATGALWLAGLRFVIRRASHLGVLLIHTLLVLLAYAWIGPFRNQGWHTSLPLTALDLLFAIGALAWAVPRVPVSGRTSVAARRVAGGIAVGLLALWIQSTLAFGRSYAGTSWWGLKNRRYHEVAEWLNGHVRSGASLFANEFGTLGYLTGLRMIDPHGLIDWTNDFPRTRSSADWFDLVRHYEPDLVLVNTEEEQEGLERRFGYETAVEFPWRSWARAILVADPAVLVRREPDTAGR